LVQHCAKALALMLVIKSRASMCQSIFRRDFAAAGQVQNSFPALDIVGAWISAGLRLPDEGA
jgi:hypothetical protein